MNLVEGQPVSVYPEIAFGVDLAIKGQGVFEISKKGRQLHLTK